MGVNLAEACDMASRGLADVADPDKAVAMQAYMKTAMPFYGVPKPGRVELVRKLCREFVPDTQSEYQDLVLALWNLPHREEKYLALGVGAHHQRFHTPTSLPLFRRLIVEGAWWDLVDEVANHMVRPVVIAFPAAAWQFVDRWIDDPDMWLRRSAIICQVGAKGRTDADRLFRFCRQRAFEHEFFIRKAIGWALREYAKTDPQAVAAFAMENRSQLSGLSFREATKHITDLIG